MLCVEVFSIVISTCVSNKELGGILVARNAPVFSHLLFVDDNILFTMLVKMSVGR